MRVEKGGDEAAVSGPGRDGAVASTEDAPSKKDRRKALIERELLEQACLLFAKQGFDRTSLSHIADAVGLTRGAVYYYFKNKEALLQAILQEVTFSPVVEMAKWRNAMPDGSAAERLASFIRLRVESVLKHGVQLRIIELTEVSLPPDLLKRHTAAKRQIFAEYRTLIQAGVQSGEFRQVDDRVAALSIIGMVNWVPQWFKAGRGATETEVADQIADLAVASVLLDEPGRRRPKTPQAMVRSLHHDLDQLSLLLADRTGQGGGAPGLGDDE